MSKFFIHESQKFSQVIFSIIFSLAFLTFIIYGQAKSETDALQLSINQTVEREMTGAETHRYKFDLRADEFVKVYVEQKGIDVIVSLFNPENKKLSEVDSPNGSQGIESVLWITEQNGTYNIEVKSLDENAPAGNYIIRLVERRAATVQDHKKVKADLLLNEAESLSDQETKESRQAATFKYKQACQLYSEIGDNKAESDCLNSLGIHYGHSLNNHAASLETFLRSLELRKAVGDKRRIALSLNNIGLAYSRLGNREKALESSLQALQIYQEMGDKNGEARSLLNIGVSYGRQGDRYKAIEYFKRALTVFHSSSDFDAESATLNNIGVMYHDLKNDKQAIEYHLQALQVSRDNKMLGSTGSALINIGVSYESLGDNQKAMEAYTEALLIKRVTHDNYGEITTLQNITNIKNKVGEKRLCVFFRKIAINRLQEMRLDVQRLDKNAQQRFLKLHEHSYRVLTDYLIDNHRLIEAQQVLNSFKDQQFFDVDRILAKQITPIFLTLRETELIGQYNKISDHISSILQQLNNLQKTVSNQSKMEITKQIEQLERNSASATGEFYNFLKQTETEFSKPADEKDKVGDVPDTTQMETALRNLSQQTGQKTVAVYTLVGEDNFRALIVSPDGIKAVSSPIKATELNEKALKLWGLLQSDKYDTTILSKQIYDVVFAPIENELPKETTTIMWSLDGNLRYLPMAALFDGKRFLAERYNHVNFTRADSERLTRNVNPDWTGTGFGTSNAQTVDLLGDKISFSALPGVKSELSEIFKQTNSKTGILTGEVLPDAKFTKTSFLEAMKRKRPLVHIASHFSFRPGDEARSFLLLGDGTAFTLNEMKAETNLFEGVDLLTLSACNTAAAQADANGREIDGFAELAQRLGAGAVMATLWSVSDASTPWLMRDFYATRQSQVGMTKAEALRKAQLQLLNGTAKTMPLPNAEKGDQGNKIKIVITPDGKRDANDTTRAEIVYVAKTDAPPYKKDAEKPFAHPYYWSPFVLFGNNK